MKGSYSCRLKKNSENYLGIIFSVKQEHQRGPRNPGTFLSILLHREKWSLRFENLNSMAQVGILTQEEFLNPKMAVVVNQNLLE